MYSVQGWGQLVNLGVLMVGLLAFNRKGSGPYSHGAAGATYRFSFGFIAVLVLWMAYYRTWRMKPARGPEAEPLRGAEGGKDAKQGRKVRGCPLWEECLVQLTDCFRLLSVFACMYCGVVAMLLYAVLCVLCCAVVCCVLYCTLCCAVLCCAKLCWLCP